MLGVPTLRPEGPSSPCDVLSFLAGARRKWTEPWRALNDPAAVSLTIPGSRSGSHPWPATRKRANPLPPVKTGWPFRAFPAPKGHACLIPCRGRCRAALALRWSQSPPRGNRGIGGSERTLTLPAAEVNQQVRRRRWSGRRRLGRRSEGRTVAGEGLAAELAERIRTVRGARDQGLALDIEAPVGRARLTSASWVRPPRGTLCPAPASGRGSGRSRRRRSNPAGAACTG